MATPTAAPATRLRRLSRDAARASKSSSLLGAMAAEARDSPRAQETVAGLGPESGSPRQLRPTPLPLGAPAAAAPFPNPPVKAEVPRPANSPGPLRSRLSGCHPPLPLEPPGRSLSEPAMRRLLSGRSRGAKASAAAVTEPTGPAGCEGAGGAAALQEARWAGAGRQRPEARESAVQRGPEGLGEGPGLQTPSFRDTVDAERRKSPGMEVGAECGGHFGPAVKVKGCCVAVCGRCRSGGSWLGILTSTAATSRNGRSSVKLFTAFRMRSINWLTRHQRLRKGPRSASRLSGKCLPHAGLQTCAGSGRVLEHGNLWR
ncbi:uncharacterized protein LOC101572444 [Octodon degus]|uniref:Uncharacterized protein LOC101572444 n=1 Tax=Octodon degus TaxID=10160 RepID=A0A6P6F3W7_OCTDE|nr:uncharacterized protein LOC101572444 [Octodon degus]